MKRALFVVAIVVALAALSGSATAQDAQPARYDTATVVVNGDRAIPAIIVDGRVYAAVRDMATSLGATIKWDPAAKVAFVVLCPAVEIAGAAPTTTTLVTDTPAPSPPISDYSGREREPRPPAPTLSPEEARAAYDAAVAKANSDYEAAMMAADDKYRGMGVGSNCSHWAAYLIGCAEAYQHYSGGSGSFNGEDYSLYLITLDAAGLAREAGCAVAGCPDLEALYDQAVKVATATRGAALDKAAREYRAAGGRP